MVLLLFRLLNTVLFVLVLMVLSMWLHSPARAALVLGGSTGSSGTGGFILTNGNPIVDVFHPAYDNSPTGPALPNSNWVWDTVAGTVNNPITFEFDFDLTGFDPSTATLGGLWGADNTAFAFLNGNPIASLPNPNISNFNPMVALNVGAGTGFFTAGINLLSFTAEDFGPPGAFRTAFRIDADEISPVPLPAGAPMLILALMGLGWIRFRRQA